MKESWKDIPGYEGIYQADREGNIRHIFPSGKSRIMTAYLKSTTNSVVVKLTKEGRAKEESVLGIMARTFLGKVPNGYTPYHKNGIKFDNYINNITYISRKELGKKTGAKSKRKTVAKINCYGEIEDVYSSAREAARKNYLSYQTVIDRCNGKRKSAYAPDGYSYAWEDEKESIRNALAKIEETEGYMPKAKISEFEW